KDFAVGFIGDLYLNHVNKQGLATIPVKEEVKGVVGWAKPNNDQFSPAAQEFIKVLKSQC
ncbi:MAG: hypothetical protein H6Q64_1768, partial [Firmicutes bacterium]|nr:hypothetical protein [Bacillota bacterium]